MTDSQLLSAEPLATGLGRALLESDLIAVIAADAHDRVSEWGGGAERLFGYSREAALGRELAELIVPEELRERRRRSMAAAPEQTGSPRPREPDARASAADERREVLRTRSPSFTFHWRLATPEANERIVAVRGKVLLDEDGDPARLTGTVRDVTADWHAARTRDLLAYVVES